MSDEFKKRSAGMKSEKLMEKGEEMIVPPPLLAYLKQFACHFPQMQIKAWKKKNLLITFLHH